VTLSLPWSVPIRVGLPVTEEVGAEPMSPVMTVAPAFVIPALARIAKAPAEPRSIVAGPGTVAMASPAIALIATIRPIPPAANKVRVRFMRLTRRDR